MSARQKVLLLLSFPVIILISAILAGESTQIELFPSSSSYSAGSAGTKALFLLLQELHLAPDRYRRAFRDIDSHAGTMIVADPYYVEFTSKQALILEKWVKKGNRLIIFESTRSSSTKGKTPDSVLKSLSKPSGSSPASHFGLTLRQFPHQPRKDISTSLPGLKDEIVVSASGENRWLKPSDEWTVLAQDESGPLLVMKKFGDGYVFACSDPSIISNRYIAREQNLRLALALLVEKNRRGEILFDEFHHGRRVEEGFWTYVGASVFGWVFLQIAVGFTVFFYSKRAELAGRFRSLTPRGGRSSVEYVDSMANIFQSCKADTAALEAILARFLSRVSRGLGIPLKDLDDEALSRVGATFPRDSIDLAALIGNARQALKTGKPSDILDAARSLAANESALDKGLLRTLESRLAGIRK